MHEHVRHVGEYEFIEHLWTGDQAEARRVETELLSSLNPRCNVNKRAGRIFGESSPVRPLSMVRFQSDVKAALERLARAEDRTIGNLVNRIVAEYLRARKLIK